MLDVEMEIGEGEDLMYRGHTLESAEGTYKSLCWYKAG